MTAVPRQRRRGEPVVVLLAIGAMWIGGRALTWETPVYPDAVAQADGSVRFDRPVPTDIWAPIGRVQPTSAAPQTAQRMAPQRAGSQLEKAATHRLAWQPTVTQATLPTEPKASLVVVDGPAMIRPLAPPPALASARPAELPPSSIQLRRKGWRVDGWYAWRPGSGLPRLGTGAASALAYGGTQGGVVLRADLGASEYRPQAYLRAVHSPARPAQGDLALGFGARPIPSVPVRFQGEARVTRIAGETSVRPAVAAIAELSPVALPFGFSAETYGQAGWVGGRYATAFVDGQVRVERPLLAAGPARVQVGAGAWGGAQKFAGRLDVGPSASVALDLGGTAARIAVDYRIKVLGDARPDNGVAVTLSTGF